jgi:hypothetical protein
MSKCGMIRETDETPYIVVGDFLHKIRGMAEHNWKQIEDRDRNWD